jgi:TPR repeat protein
VSANAFAFSEYRKATDSGWRAALPFFRRAAEAGHPQALGALGDYYDRGLAGLQQDDAEAARWWRLAAAAGDEQSAAFLRRAEEQE